jgi:DNA-binding FadR family transcriptional regulator
MNGEPLRKHSLRERAVEVLKRHMLEAKLLPGANLPTERDLSQGLAVSRSVIREALTALEAEGLVERRPSAGYYVTPAAANLHINSAEQVRRQLVEAAEVRLSFELGVAHLVAERISNEELVALEQKAHELDQAMDRQEAHAEAEMAFHLAVWTVAKNSALLAVGRQIIGDYFRALALVRPGTFVHPAEAADAARHQPLIDALRTRQIKVILAALTEHCRLPRTLA